jgi:hypothetical protein
MVWDVGGEAGYINEDRGFKVAPIGVRRQETARPEAGNLSGRMLRWPTDMFFGVLNVFNQEHSFSTSLTHLLSVPPFSPSSASATPQRRSAGSSLASSTGVLFSLSSNTNQAKSATGLKA